MVGYGLAPPSIECLNPNVDTVHPLIDTIPTIDRFHPTIDPVIVFIVAVGIVIVDFRPLGYILMKALCNHVDSSFGKGCPVLMSLSFKKDLHAPE